MLRILLLLPAMMHLSAASFNSNVCKMVTATPPAQPQIPTLPDTFEAHIELKLVKHNTSVAIREYFDRGSAQTAVVVENQKDKTYYFLRYNTHELLTVSTKYRTCSLSNLDDTRVSFLFGRTGSASSVLHVDQDGGHIYEGLDSVRGIRVHKWTFCQYWTLMDATMNVTWYFADEPQWMTGMDAPVTPIRAWVRGHVGGSSPHVFEHIYDIFHFNNYITNPTAFEYPSYLPCPATKSAKAIPKFPEAFSLTTEIVTSLDHRLSYMQQWFDSALNMVRHTYHTSLQTDWISETHDYNTGVAYMIDQKLGNCTCVPIERGDNDDIAVDSSHVKMMTSREFFQMDSSNATYQGVKSTRGMPVDVFAVTRHDYPPSNPVPTVWEWHFTQKNESRLRQDTLLQTVMYLPGMDQSIIYNVFDVLPLSATDRTPWHVDECFISWPHRIFQFDVPGSATKDIKQNPGLFKYGVALSVQLTADISPLRVSNIQLQYGDNVTVTFDMFEVPSISGDVAHKIAPLTPLNVAAKSLVAGFRHFTIYYPFTGQPHDVKVYPDSLREIVVGPTSSSSPTPRSSTSSSTSSFPKSSSTPFVPPTVKNMPIPSLPTTFEVHVIRVMPDTKTSTETHEVFNQTAGLISLRTATNGEVSLKIINVTNREVRTIDPDSGTCQVSNLGTGSVDSLLGYTEGVSGKGEITSIAGALVYGSQRPYVFRGKALVRKIRCLQWEHLNVTLGGDASDFIDVMWYFSDPNNWDTALNWPWTPVRATVLGQYKTGLGTNVFQDTYEFIHFKNFIDEQNTFQPPPLVQCAHGHPAKQFPGLARAASFTQEAIGVHSGTISNIQESFDTEIGLLRLEYTSRDTDTRVTEVRDFNTGVVYITDDVTGNCTANPIRKSQFYSTNGNSSLASQLFHTDNATYSYEGQTLTRDIPSDRFVGAASIAGVPTQLEWRFATGDYSRSQRVLENYYEGVPLQIIQGSAQNGTSIVYNIYNYVQTHPDLLKWDVTSCYLTRDRRRVQFSVAGRLADKIRGSVGEFKRGLLLSLMATMGVSPLRVAQLQVDFGKDVNISLTVLDIAPVHSNVISGPKETSLTTACRLLQSSVQGGNFFIPMGDSVITAIPSSFREIAEGPDATRTTFPRPTQTPARTATPSKPPPSTTHTLIENTHTSDSVTMTTTKTIPLPGSTSANVLCDAGGSEYSTGVVVGVCVAMVILGGAGGTVSAIFLGRRKPRMFSQSIDYIRY